jgi:5-methyltetrahydropteroyltriglutamate--homocysteine methyltransferase
LVLPAIDRALDGISVPTALHLCFGYAYVARDKPNGYSLLPELTASKAHYSIVMLVKSWDQLCAG